MADKESRDVAKCLARSPVKPKRDPVSDTLTRPRSPKPPNFDLDSGDGERQFRAPSNVYSHPVYHDISFINGQVNRMDLSEMKKRCQELKLDSEGKREAVKRRLKEHLKEQKLVEAGLLEPSRNRNVDYFVIIDFEATCEAKNPSDYKHEIIEFPAVLVSSAESPRIVDIFHSYCRPVINPILSEFCRTLTGIEQSTVDNALTFPEVHKNFIEWLEVTHKLGTDNSFCIVTDGPFDMGRFLFLQTRHLNMPYPSYGKSWVNLRKAFSNFYKADFYSSSGHVKLPGLQTMLSSVGLEFEGQPHSGLDDAKNIARIIMRLISDRAYLRINERIVLNENEAAIDNNNVRLKNVATVSMKESQAWFRQQKKNAVVSKGLSSS